nr:helix-turn-helix transcriptional regulator [Gordonia sp. SID5947]
MRQRVENWVNGRLPFGPISPSDAAAAHGISVRSLHRLFDGPGRSFGSMVRSARLECARQELLTSMSTVQHIAARWGYSDMSHFGREFKRTYGMTTTEFRALHHTHPQAG